MTGTTLTREVELSLQLHRAALPFLRQDWPTARRMCARISLSSSGAGVHRLQKAGYRSGRRPWRAGPEAVAAVALTEGERGVDSPGEPACRHPPPRSALAGAQAGARSCSALTSNIIRAACRVAEQDQVLVIGSQSVLGTYGELELPEESTFSEEADVFPLFDDADGTKSTQIDGTLVEQVSSTRRSDTTLRALTAVPPPLPAGWAERLVPIETRTPTTTRAGAWTCTICAVQKLIANRDKDRAFVTALIHDDLVLVSYIRERLELTEVDVQRKRVALDWLSMWDDVQPNYRVPELPAVPANWQGHPAA